MMCERVHAIAKYYFALTYFINVSLVLLVVIYVLEAKNHSYKLLRVEAKIMSQTTLYIMFTIIK